MARAPRKASPAPFLIFTWRGRTQEELIAGLRARRGRPRKPAAADPPPAVTEDASFWHSGPQLAELRVSPLAGEAPDALLRRLGPAPIEAGERNVVDVLAGMYAQLAEAAERRALTE